MKKLLIALLLLVGCNSSPKLYEFKEPVNNKNSAIIRITSNYSTTCTAFVISDKYAVTAGHCVSSACEKAEEEKDEFAFNPMSDVECGKSIKFIVANSRSQDTGIRASVAYHEYDDSEGGTDYALLKGNFTDFNRVKIELRGFALEMDDALVTCGYARSKYPPVCTYGTFKGIMLFQGAATNLAIEGMSGGPVFNKDGAVIGINNAARTGGSYFNPIIGVINFELE